MKQLLRTIFILSVLAFMVTGCASRSYVDEQLNKALASEIGAVRSDLDEIKADLDANTKEIEELKSQGNDELMETVQEALKRAEEAKKLAMGKLIYEVTISDESVPFSYKKSKLSEDAKAALDIFANVLIEENEDVYLEIQGHTDNIGTEDYNLKLGQARADAVRAYLHTEHGIPLHKMSTFSYGESKPLVPNNSAENRAKNRRVTILVME